MLAFRCILALNLALSVYASLYVVNPLPTTSCRASHPCTVQWLDDGTVPLLSDIGVSTVGLYSGDEELVQTITPVNVNNVHTLIFTPDPKAGPNSNKYYIAFTSTTLKETNGTGYYQSFSSNFRLTQMTGSSNSHPASDTSSKAIPSSLRTQTATGTGAQSQSMTTTTIVTVGTLSTSSYVVSTLPATGSSASSSTATTPAASANATGASGGAQSSGAASSCTAMSPLALLVLSALLSLLL